MKPGIVSESLAVTLGHDGQAPVVLDLSQPGSHHLLVAGTVGSGKTVLLENLLRGLMAQTADLEVVMFDSKGLEHDWLHATDVGSVWFAADTEEMMELLRATGEVLAERLAWLRRGGRLAWLRAALPTRLVVFDEFADFVYGDGFDDESRELLLAVLREGPAAGMHVVAATQRPMSDVLPGWVLGPMGARIALRVHHPNDSRLLLGSDAASQLQGTGRAIVRVGARDRHFTCRPPPG